MKGCAPWPLCSSLTQHDAGILELRGTIWYGRVWCTYMLGVILFQKLIVSPKRRFNHLTRAHGHSASTVGEGKGIINLQALGTSLLLPSFLLPQC